MPSTEQIRDTVDQYIERFNAGDGGRWASLFAEDATHEDPVGTPANVGRDAIAAFYESSASSFGTIRLHRKDEPIVAGNEAVVTLWVQIGSGAQRTKIPHIVDVFTFRETGEIASLRAYWDMASLTPDPA